MILRTLAVMAFAAGLTGLAPPARAAAPVFTDKACPSDWPTGLREVRCGTLTVDEARDGSVSDRRIDIAVVIFKASAPYKDASGQALPPMVTREAGVIPLYLGHGLMRWP
jgi:hypothetical protein